MSTATFAQDSESKKTPAYHAIERSLPFLESQGIAWIKERGCVTCHHTPFLIWTHGEARRRGFKIDQNKVEGWRTWAFLQMVSTLDSGVNDEADTLSQLLLSRDASSSWFDKPPKWHSRHTDPFENITKHLLKGQAADGTWAPGGQSGNPKELPTAWALLALFSRDAFMNSRFPKRESSDPILKLVESNDKTIPAVRGKALAWLRQQDPKKTEHLTEAVITRLMVEKQIGKPETANELLHSLLVRQNPDGGWSADIKLRQPSDAFATGQSLYALHTSGYEAERVKKAITQATEFLIKTQAKDGSWLVRTTAFYPSKGKAEREKLTDEVYTYWGTSWATLGLLHSLPMAKDAK